MRTGKTDPDLICFYKANPFFFFFPLTHENIINLKPVDGGNVPLSQYDLRAVQPFMC